MSFKSPNYTQVPNDFFDMAPDMSESELRVTLSLLRQTFGFHRKSTKMGISDLEKSTGMSEQGVRNGTKAAENRQTFRRLNPNTQEKSEWEIFIDPNEVDPYQVDPYPLLNGGSPPTTCTTGTPLNKDINKDIKKKDFLDIMLSTPAAVQQAELVAETYNRMDSVFNSTFARNAKNDAIVKFVIAREKQGESLERFGQWARRDEFNASRTWEYAENPIKIKTRWAVAMQETQSDGHSFLEGV